MGDIEGYVTQLPQRTTGAGVPVYFCPSGPNPVTDPSGYFIISAPGLFRQNHWGVAVFGGGTGPGTATYMLTATTSCDDAASVNVESSKLATVGLSAKSPGMEDPTIRPPKQPSPGPTCAKSEVGEPVSVTTGNVFFDQTDAVVAGVRTSLDFTRSYNSQNAYRQIVGGFGQGWWHAYEKALSFPYTGVVMLRRGDGTAAYYQDMDGDLTYQASVPITETSWIVKTGTTYTLYFRAGGYETYDSAGRLGTAVDPFGNQTTFGRDPQGRLTTIAAPGGRTLELTWSAAWRISSLSGPDGVIADYTYDGASRLKTVTYPDGSGYSFTYDPPTGQVLTVSDHTGRVLETHTYSLGKALTSEISGGVENYGISYGMLKTTVTDALGNVTTYDWTNIQGMKYVTKITGPCSSCGGGNQTQEWTYDTQGRITSYKDGAGNVTTYTYDPATGDMLSEEDPLDNTTTYTYDTQGRVLTRTDAAGGQTTYVYGPAGPTSITEKLTSSTSRTTSINYTPQGLPDTITDPRSKVTTLAYNSFGDLTSVTAPPVAGSNPLVTTFGYDALGRRTTVTDALNNTTTTVYDDVGRVTQITDPNLKSTYFTYDLGGRRLTVKDALNRITTNAYDAYGRLETVTDALTGVTTYGYDLMSHLTSLTDARSKTTGFTYNEHGQVTKVTYPGGVAFESFSYDSAGRLATRTDRKGVVTTYTYDDAGRLTDKTYSDGTPPVSYSYDDVGRPLTAANGTDTLTWTYDLAGQVLTEASTRNNSTVAYTYDLGGNRLTLNQDGSLFVSYVYDDASRLTTITRGVAAWTLTYDAASRRKSLRHPNTVQTNYAYDTVSRLTSAMTRKGTTTITSSTYTYDDVGNRLTKGGDFSESYLYDPLYRLKQAKRGAPVTEQYTYDSVGNRLSALGSSPWTYDDRNQLLSLPGTTFTYDPNGNLDTRSEASGAWAHVWNVENQLTSVLQNGNEVARFSYDPLGRRVEKVAGGVTTKYTYDGQDILRETPSTGTTLKYVHGPGIDEPLAHENGSGALTSFHADGLGSITKTTNSAGTAVLSRRYDAFGRLQLGATTGGYAYTGREWDPEVQLYYYRARYYDPKVGRFIGEDPIGFHGGINFYEFVSNAPTTLIDPFGLASEDPGFPPVFPKTPPMPARRPSNCCQKRIQKSMDDVVWQIRRMYLGQTPSGTSVASSTARAWLPQPGGWMTPILDPPQFFTPVIREKDPCVRYCIRLHEWVHFTDPRPWNVRWSAEAMTNNAEYPAYVTELECLYSFLK